MMRVEGWGKAKISHFGEIITGSTPDTKNLNYWGGDIPFVSPADFSSSIFVYKTDKTLTEQGAKQARIVPEKSILVTCIGSIGGIAIVPRYCVTNQQINSVVCKENFDALFVYYLIRNNLFRLQELAGTTTLPIINKSTFSDIDLIYPKSKSEQEQIAAVLSTIDRAIAQTEAIIAKQQRIKTGLMQDLLTKGIDEHGNIRSEATHEFKDSAIGRIPVEWETVSMEKITTKIVDGIHHKPNYVQEGIPFIVVTDLTSSEGINFNPSRFITKKDHQEFYKRADPKPKDVLVTKDGTLGVARIIPDEAPDFSIFVSVAMIRPKNTECIPELIWSFFDSGRFLTQLGSLSAGTGLAHIHLEHFRKFQINLMSIDEQKRIFEVLNHQHLLLKKQYQDLGKLKLQKTGLMQDLLTGKVRVTELLKERKRASP